ncbi:MAG: hypothetical protein IT427_18765 [Pirellulales bacterium]|nr:hypothetical protein [Pirellulales bacterium]
MNHRIPVVVWMLMASLTCAAERTESDKPNITAETVYSGLDWPCGVAVQSTTGSVVVSESRAGQIVRFPSNQFDQPKPVVTGFPRATAGIGLMKDAGPMGLAFFNQNLIVIGGSERKDGNDEIRIYELSADTSKEPLNFANAKRTLRRTWASEAASDVGINLWGLAMSPSALWVTAQGEHDIDALLKASIGGNLLEDLSPFFRTKEATRFDRPMGLAIRNSREFLTVSFAGKFDAPGDSVLAFFHLRGRSLLMALPTKLHDLVGLAYSPKSDRLYAVDVAWNSPADGALYRLDSAIVDGRVGVKAVKMAAFDRPTALAFAPDNTLYVTVLGAERKVDQDEAKTGSLVKITGDL